MGGSRKFLHMFDSKRRLSALEARIHELERDLSQVRVDMAELEPAALENLRRSVLNALRSLRRVQAASDDRAAAEEAPEPILDDLSRLALERRKHVIPRSQQG